MECFLREKKNLIAYAGGGGGGGGRDRPAWLVNHLSMT